MSDRVAGVVLAAGVSSRMGTDKLLLKIGGTSVLRRAVSTAVSAGLDPVLVVVGSNRVELAAELAGLEHTLIENIESARGIGSSLRAGITAVPEDAAGAVVMLADMPFVTADLLRELLACWRESSAPLAISLYGEVAAPPMLYGRALFAELRDTEREVTGKMMVQRHRSEAVAIALPEAALADLDTPADVERARARLEGS